MQATETESDSAGRKGVYGKDVGVSRTVWKEEAPAGNRLRRQARQSEGAAGSRDCSAVCRAAAMGMSIFQTPFPSLSPAKGSGPRRESPERDGQKGLWKSSASAVGGQTPGSSMPPRLNSKGGSPKGNQGTIRKGKWV